MTPRQRGQIAALYREGKDVKEIAAEIGAVWPVVHLAVFDMKRAGILPKRPKKRRAA